jgi:uncharacterized protein with von Willebrand factor type A (vWA) domain
MKSSYRATKIALLVTFGGVYPVMLLADALDWPVGVQLGLGVLALVALIGTRIALTDWDEWRADRRTLRQERAQRRRERAERRAGRARRRRLGNA